jgi:hypothetical protein
MEVMVALSLIAMLAGAVTSFLWSLSSRQISLSRASMEAQAADTLLDRLEGDLLSGLAGDPRLGAGIDGSATRLRLLTRGVDVADGGAGDLQESVFEYSGGTLSMSRRPVGTGGAESAPASVHPLSTGLSRVRFRYFDGRGWKSSFNSASLGRLPAAIEVEVWQAGRAPAAGGGSGTSEAAWPEPDRSRVIVVPDGPDAAWGGSSSGGGT